MKKINALTFTGVGFAGSSSSELESELDSAGFGATFFGVTAGAFFFWGSSSSELESELELDSAGLDATFLTAAVFFGAGVSSSELESDELESAFFTGVATFFVGVFTAFAGSSSDELSSKGFYQVTQPSKKPYLYVSLYPSLSCLTLVWWPVSWQGGEWPAFFSAVVPHPHLKSRSLMSSKPSIETVFVKLERVSGALFSLAF